MGLNKDKHDLQKSSGRGGDLRGVDIRVAALLRVKKNQQDHIFRRCKTVSHLNNCKEWHREELSHIPIL